MKKTAGFAVCLILVMALPASVWSQSHNPGPETPVGIGSIVANAGFGIGGSYEGYYNNVIGTKLAMEVGIWQAGPGVVTLGGEVGGLYSSGGYYSNYKSRTLVIAARSAWHYGWKVAGLDTYGGVATGIGIRHYKFTSNTDYSVTENIFYVGAFVGASYFISPSFGFNVEAGYDVTTIQAGIIVKLR